MMGSQKDYYKQKEIVINLEEENNNNNKSEDSFETDEDNSENPIENAELE